MYFYHKYVLVNVLLSTISPLLAENILYYSYWFKWAFMDVTFNFLDKNILPENFNKKETNDGLMLWSRLNNDLERERRRLSKKIPYLSFNSFRKHTQLVHFEMLDVFVFASYEIFVFCCGCCCCIFKAIEDKC